VAPSGEYEIIFDPKGQGRHLATPGSDDVFASVGAKETTWRNSHVETWNSLSDEAQNWITDKVTVDYPELYTPFLTSDTGYRHWVNFWWADMLPVGGPVLGPFDTHEDAIAAEVEWLNAKNLPHPK